jgi:hypothetical protein
MRWWGLLVIGSLALTYFRTRNGHYHWRGGVSRSCSGWEGVVPPCYGHQTKLVYLVVANLGSLYRDTELEEVNLDCDAEFWLVAYQA